MHRHRVTLVTTAIALAALLAVALAITAAAPAAPRWPAASLAYWEEAQPLLETLADETPKAFKAAGNPASAQVITDTVTIVTDVVNTVAELDPPTPLLAAHLELAYAAGACKSAVGYSQGLTFNNLAAAVQVPVFTSFALECQRSINDARVEAARYASTVGGFPASSD